MTSKQKFDIHEKPLSTYNEYMFHKNMLICILIGKLWFLGSSLGLSSKKLKRIKRGPPTGG